MTDSSRIEELTVVARGLGFEVICREGAIPRDPEVPLGMRLALAAASGLSADVEECHEIHRVLSKSVEEFTRRNAAKIKTAHVPAPEVL